MIRRPRAGVRARHGRLLVRLLLGLLLLFILARPSWAIDWKNASQELDAEYAYVGATTVRGAGFSVHDVDEQSADIKYVIAPQITENLLLRLGMEWQSLFFGVPDSAPVPDVLGQVSAVVGFDYQLTDLWLVRSEIEPGWYGDYRGLRWDTMDAPLVLGGAYLANPDLQWFFGMRVDLRSQFPVLPAMGVRWKFNGEWTLNLQPPKPRVEYELNDNVNLYFGAEFVAGTFRVGPEFGTDRGLPRIDNKVVDYTEIRIGPGVSWKVRPNITLEAGAGFVPYSSFDFFEANVAFRGHNAPYGQLTCHARF